MDDAGFEMVICQHKKSVAELGGHNRTREKCGFDGNLSLIVKLSQARVSLPAQDFCIVSRQADFED